MLQEKFENFIDDLKTPEFAAVMIVLLFALFLGFYVPYQWSKTYENPQYVKYGLPLRNIFPFSCEIEICPNEWTLCANVNNEVIKNIKCKN
jgi:hypothetical protein